MVLVYTIKTNNKKTEDIVEHCLIKLIKQAVLIKYYTSIESI